MSDFSKSSGFTVAFVALLLALSGCGFPPNSVSGDTDVYADSAANGSAAFKKVAAIIKSRCSRCHSQFVRYDEESWVTSGYVSPGDAAGSSLFGRLKGAGVGGMENMPIDSGSLNTTEIETIRFWIEEVAALAPDDELTAVPTEEELSARRQAALAVLSNRCQQCHSTTQTATSAGHSGETVPAFANFTNESEFIASGLIVAKYAAASWLYDALQIYGSIDTMPKNASPLTVEEKNAVRQWIAGLP